MRVQLPPPTIPQKKINPIIIGRNSRTMESNNKTLLITGIIVIGLVTVYMGNNELGAVALGGLVGYLSKDREVNTTVEVEDNGT